MSVEKALVYGSPNIGVYVTVTENEAFIAADAPEKFEEAIKSALGVEVHRVSLLNSPLVGVFLVANSNGMLIPKHAHEHEINTLKRIAGENMEVGVLDLKETALGNLILTNDRVAIVSPIIPRRVAEEIGSILGVEVIRRNIAGSPLVGSFAVATRRGVLVCPLASEDELDELESIFKIPVDVGTVNRGSIFIRAGIVANGKGAVVGYGTTGPELMRIHRVLFSKT